MGALPDFLTSILLQNIKKMKGTLWRHYKIFEKKSQSRKGRGRSHSAEKSEKGEPFALVQFDTLKFTNYFGQFVWIEKSL